MTPDELKGKLLRLISVLAELPEDADILTARVDDRTDGYILLMHGFTDAVTTLHIDPSQKIIDDDTVLRTACVRGVILKDYIKRQDSEV